ncbi:MAG: redoxin domain-containing protein [Saprospiraceae bacterium]|nr:redoxin domain-containing protein [Saprospiraceae bacterium]
MRLLSLIVFLFVAIIRLHAQTADSVYIDVTMQGLAAGKAKLIGTYCDQNYLADSAVIDAGGHFVLRRNKSLPPGYYYFLLPGNKSFSFLIDRDQKFSLKGNINDLPNSMEVNGSLNTDLLYRNFRFQSQQDPELNRVNETIRRGTPGTPEYAQAKARQDQLMADRKAHLDELYRQFPDALFTKFKIAGQNPDWPDFKKPNGDTDTARQVQYYRAHFWDGVDFKDERLLYTPVIGNKLRRYIKELTPQQPDSLIKVSDALIRQVMPHKPYFKFFANWIAGQYENTKSTVMDGEAVYVHIIKNFFTPELAFWDKPENLEKLQKHAWEMEASLMGRKGPDVAAPNQYGQMKSIYEIKASIIVIFMYSPDCEHCQEQSPKLEQFYQRWKNRGVEVFGIAVNTTDKEWKDFLVKQGFTFTNVFDPSNRAIYAKYFVDITPELYVLNKDRTIVAKNLNVDQLDTVVEREFRKMK